MPRSLILLCITLIGLAGCAARLPTYDPMAPRDAWSIVAARALAARTVTAEADAVLTGTDGDTMRVDAAVVLAHPDRVRMRAWKVGHAVLDVTGDGDSTWIDPPPAPERTSDLGVAPAELTRGLLLIPAWVIASAEPATAHHRGDWYLFEVPSPGGDLICEVDARTLTVRRWRPAGVHGGFTLELDAYRLVGEIPWPHEATLRDGDRSVRLRLRNVALDGDIDTRAFTPPPGARRSP